MKKLQISLVVVAVLLGLGLFTLPKIVVKNLAGNTANMAEKPHTDEDSHNADTSMHTSKVSEKQSVRLSELKGNLAKATTPTLQLVALDSLINFWTVAQRLDSAVVYAEKSLILENNEFRLLKVANLYYDAFSFALKADKAQKMALKAESYLQKVLDKNPKLTETKVKLGLTIKYLNPQQPMKGILLVREASKEDPKNALALFSLGSLFAERNDFAKAVEQFEKLVNAHPTHVEGWAYLANSYEQTGQKEKAIQAWEQVKTLDPRPEVQKQVDENLRKLK
jgi:outer membrane protein